MEQIKQFLNGTGLALLLPASLLAAAAAGVWAVRALRAELQKSLDEPDAPGTTQQTTPETEPDWDAQEATTWQQPVTDVAISKADVPQQTPSGASSGAQSGSGSLREPSALQGASSPASSSAAPASTQPVSGRVLNGYSGDELVYSKTLGDWRTHNGVDYACAEGSAVSAPCSGKVTETGTDGRWSSVVTLEDASGRLWRVCGVNSPAVKPGDTVTAGQKLGTVGTISCECAEEAHIHLEVLQNGQYLDPAKIS